MRCDSFAFSNIKATLVDWEKVLHFVREKDCVSHLVVTPGYKNFIPSYWGYTWHNARFSDRPVSLKRHMVPVELWGTCCVNSHVGCINGIRVSIASTSILLAVSSSVNCARHYSTHGWLECQLALILEMFRPIERPPITNWQIWDTWEKCPFFGLIIYLLSYYIFLKQMWRGLLSFTIIWPGLL